MTKNSKAFTLVEILIAMTLTVLVIGVLYLLQTTGMSTLRKGTSQLLLTSEIRNKTERIVADFRNAKEILEISPDSVKMRTYKYSAEKPDPGEDALVTVLYEVERRERECILWRSENKENPNKLLSLQKIGENLFEPYYEFTDEQSPTGWSYYPFNMKTNDSQQRKQITFVRIKLQFENIGESATLVTSTTLRPAAARIRQPNWKLR